MKDTWGTKELHITGDLDIMATLALSLPVIAPGLLQLRLIRIILRRLRHQ